MKQLNQTLRKWREDQRLTASDVARRLGVDRTTVTKWENGSVTPNVGYDRWAEALGCVVEVVVSHPGQSSLGELDADAQAIVQRVIQALPAMSKDQRESLSHALGMWMPRGV